MLLEETKLKQYRKRKEYNKIMTYYILILLFASVCAYKTQSSIKSIPLKFLKKVKPEKVYHVEDHPSYTIPDWVYKCVFKYNKPNKYNT